MFRKVVRLRSNHFHLGGVKGVEEYQVDDGGRQEDSDPPQGLRQSHALASHHRREDLGAVLEGDIVRPCDRRAANQRQGQGQPFHICGDKRVVCCYSVYLCAVMPVKMPLIDRSKRILSQQYF